MRIEFGPLIPGTFIQRDNRFRVQIQISGQQAAAHLANSGRLGELLVPGHKVWLARADRSNHRRRTAYDLVLIESAGRLVSVDARVPTQLVEGALRHAQLAGFEEYPTVQREVRLGKSRLDFRLDAGSEQPPCWIEVKSATLVEAGVARFPDAPTLRGQRHVRELVQAVENGDRAAVLFIVQREDASHFAPHDEADPAFGRVLRQSARAGVAVYAWRCRVSHKAIQLIGTIPVRL